METLQVLEQGQVMLPEYIRQAHHWDVGQELLIVESDEGVFLTSMTLFEPTALDDVAGCLRYTGPAKTLDDMEQAISKGVAHSYANLMDASAPG